MGKTTGRGYEYYGVFDCPICGRQFVPAPFHVYKDKRHNKSEDIVLVCSYGCMLKSEKIKRDDTLGRLNGQNNGTYKIY